MTALSASTREDPSGMEGFRHLRALAAYWNGTWRYRPAGADLEAALRQIEAARRDGPDVLVARAWGDSVPELRGAALIEGAALWGETADLEAESVRDVATSMPGSRRGRFNAYVRVRCLNYAEIDQQVSEATP
jgi:hypothetical protein